MGKKAQTIGYWYKLAAHYGLCLGPIDALLEVRGGDRTAWAGRQTASGTISIDEPNLWGGEKSEGGIVGDMDVMMGEATQAPNAYLASTFGPEQSGYRGKATVVFKGGKWGALNPYPKAPAFKVERILEGWDNDTVWYAEKAVIALSAPAEDTTDGYFLVQAGAEVRNAAGDTVYHVVTEDFSATADEIGAFCIEKRNAFTGETFTWAGSYAHGSDGNWDIAAWSTELGDATGIASISVVPTCPLGYDDELTGTPGSLGLNDAAVLCSQPVAFNAMNPAHILYDSITSANGGQGEPSGLVNAASFTVAADKFHAEGFGLCMTLADGDIEAFQQRVCDIVGANLTQSRIDGQYYLDLIRDDYVFEDLLVVTEDDVVEYSEDQSEPTELVNQVIVDWFDPVAKQDRSTAPVQALGAIQAAGGVISETRTYREIPTEGLALRVAKRDRNARGTPLKRFSLTTNRRLHQLRPGIPFRLQMPSEGIADMVCRCGNVDFGTLTDGRMRLTAVQDVFSMPDTVYVDPEPGKWVPPGGALQAPPEQLVFEAPYVELASRLSAADMGALTDTAGFIATAATRPDLGTNYTLWTNAEGEEGADRGTAEWCPSALVVEAAALQDPLPTAFTLSDPSDLDQVEVGTAALWGTEIVRVDAIDATLLTVTLARGCADTVPVAHLAGERIWFYDVEAGSDAREYADGETVHARLLTRTGTAQLDLVLAQDNTVVMDGRQARPYPPAQLTINGDTFPAEAMGDVEVAWVHRDRLVQADQLFDTSAASVGPEAGTTYSVEVYDRSDESLAYSQSGITSPHLIPSASVPYECRLELYSVRDALESLQRATAEFLHGFLIEGELVGGALEETYSQGLVTTGATGSVAWSISGGALPLGWSIDGVTGVISGIATETGYFTFTVRAEDDNGAVSQREFTVGVGVIISLLHFDGADGSTTFIDENGRAWTVFGNAQIDTAQSKLGGASGLFDGAGDYLRTPTTADWNLVADGDFTVEGFVRPQVNNTIKNLLSKRTTGVDENEWAFLVDGSGKLTCWLFDTALANNAVSGATTVALSTWQHFAFVKHGTNVYIFLDGVLDGSGSFTTTGRREPSNVFVGQDSGVSSRDFNGWLDEIRITKGAARYIEAFTPPTAPSDFPA